jgi:hypothetical protein
VWNAISWTFVLHLASLEDILGIPKLMEDMSPRSVSTVITSLLWNIWKAQNVYVFREEHMSTVQVLRAVIADLQYWANRAKPEVAVVIVVIRLL